MITCKKCGEAHYVKSGYMNGLQRYKCKDCGCNFTNTKPAGVSMKTKVEALRLYMEGLGLRAIGRFFGYSNVSILNWIRSFGKIAEEYHDAQDKQGTIRVMELDEMRHFLKKNESKLESGLLMIEKGKGLLILK